MRWFFVAAGQRYLIIKIKTSYICCDFVCVHLRTGWYSGIIGSMEEGTLKQLAILRAIDEAVDARRKWRPTVILGDLNTELGKLTSACNSDHQAPLLEGPIATNLIHFFTKHSLCLRCTFDGLHHGERSTHYSPIPGYRRIDFVAVPVGWHAAIPSSYVDSTVDFLSPSEDNFLTAVCTARHFQGYQQAFQQTQVNYQACCVLHARISDSFLAAAYQKQPNTV